MYKIICRSTSASDVEKKDWKEIQQVVVILSPGSGETMGDMCSSFYPPIFLGFVY